MTTPTPDAPSGPPAGPPAGQPAGQPAEGDEELLDRIDALRVLRADTPEEKGRLLEEIAGTGRVEQDIVSELSKVRPLWLPHAFDGAHRMAMRSLEVLDRNGARPAHLPPVGPLKPVAGYLVQQATRWIVKGHQNRVITELRELYERREANSVWGSPEHRSLRRARLDAARVEGGIKGNPLGVPKILLGGAFLSGIVSGAGRLASGALANRVAVVVISVLAVALFFALAWVALYAAAVARRRIRLSTDQPLRALWDTIGAAGPPPQDQSVTFAVLAIVLLALAVIVVPIAVYLVVRAS